MTFGVSLYPHESLVVRRRAQPHENPEAAWNIYLEEEGYVCRSAGRAYRVSAAEVWRHLKVAVHGGAAAGYEVGLAGLAVWEARTGRRLPVGGIR